MTDRNFLIFGFAINDHALQKAVWRQLLIACIVMATNTCVSAQDLEKGRIEFLSKCAASRGARAYLLIIERDPNAVFAILRQVARAARREQR